MKVTGTPVVITGASSGIGAAAARAFADRGAEVVLLARSQSGLDAVAELHPGAWGDCACPSC